MSLSLVFGTTSSQPFADPTRGVIAFFACLPCSMGLILRHV